MKRICFAGNASQVVLVFAVIFSVAYRVAAQEDRRPPKAEIKFLAGVSTFTNDPTNNYHHTIVGGAVRYYVTRHISLEPEVLYMWRGQNDRDVVITPHLALDLLDPAKKVVPYVMAGVGVEHRRDLIRYFDFFNGNQLVTRRIDGYVWSANAGAGVKFFLGKRLFVAPEVRTGHEPSRRFSISIGYVFARRKE